MAEDQKEGFESREYQIELYELGIEKNIILYLPTGSGKTYIAILLMKHFCNTEDVYKKLADGGKRAFFLVNTVVLVEQQKCHIQAQTNLNVGGYSGDMGVDFWEDEDWYEELNKNQVLVMTCQIYLDLLLSSRISLQNTCIIIFDECHHGVENHPMRQVMKKFQDLPSHKWPRVVGLTATLVNRSLKPSNVQDEIKKLETTYMASIQTSINEDMVKLYSTNPKESQLLYAPNNSSGFCYSIRNQIFSDFNNLLSFVEVEEDCKVELRNQPFGSKPLKSNKNKLNKRFKNLIDDIVVNMDDLGVYGGSLAVLAHMVQIHRMLPNTELETAKILFENFATVSVYLRKVMAQEMENGGLSKVETIKHFSSDKVLKLFQFLSKVKPSDRVIIFVQRRFTAKILFYLIDNAAKVISKLKDIKCNYMVGYNVGNPFKDTRENYLQRKQNKKILNLFNQGLLNVMIASNVVEEGVDIARCNHVLMFDKLVDFRSYTQSKGRARDKDSNYVIMVSATDSQFRDRYDHFKNIESVLKEILCGGKSRLREAPTSEEVNAELFATIPGLESYKPLGSNGPVITALSAISLINRYFTSLKRDKFTKITPAWYIKPVGQKFKCFLRLPMESKVNPKLIEGHDQNNKENAQRSVALEACKKLHINGELLEHNLLPVGLNLDFNLNDDFTPNFDSDEEFTEEIKGKMVCLGSKNHKRLFKKKWAETLCECRPEADKDAYVHVIETKPTYPTPVDNPRLLYIYETFCLPYSFALISTKRLPKLASFPLYLSTGELEAQITQVNTVKLNKLELELISNFQQILFDDVLGTAKSFMIKDLSNKHNSYLIAPVTTDKLGNALIDFEICHKLSGEAFPSTSVKPTNEARETLSVTDEGFLGKVVSPWYRTIPAQKYIVTRVRHDMTEESEFPNDSYSTYKDYFKDKYTIEPLCIGQPLIEVRAFSDKLKSIKPRSLTKQLRWKNKEESEDFEVTLVPEFCIVYPLDGQYWLKALLLPSALHRISQLTLAEELRITIARDTQTFPINAPPEWLKLCEDESLRKGKEVVIERAQAFTALPGVKGTSPMSSQSTHLQEPWDDDEEEPIDIDRNIERVTVFDIYSFESFVQKPLLGVDLKSNLSCAAKRTKLVGNSEVDLGLLKEFVTPPTINMLSKTTFLGPEQTDLMQALITANAKDFVNCERLETLGDSFLKFAVSLTLFDTQPNMLEGHLTHIKGKVVGNKNLYFCGKSKNIEAILQVQDFSPNEEWVPPGFWVEESIQNVICSVNINPTVLHNIAIPQEERVSGVMSSRTMDIIQYQLINSEDSPQPSSCVFLNQQALSDKNISDCVEAILGVYLKNCGTQGALAVMNFFKVMSPKLSNISIFSRCTTAAIGEGNPNTYLQQPNLLETVLHYKFRDRSFLLQALTHSTFTRNIITPCYQRLEFLGDAVIDFLITTHIFEKCIYLSPGDLTDLRSALVNNITLACLSVRYNFHKYILYHSALLNEVIMRFVCHQNSKNHVIDKDVLFLLEEKDVNIAEAVEVPKALGDVFEAIIGAIYLDSGKDLAVTWVVLYNLMKDEIDSFSSNIPKNHVRMLYETGCEPIFLISKEGNISMASVEVQINKETKRFNGFGDNRRDAKRAAAKHALRAYQAQSTSAY